MRQRLQDIFPPDDPSAVGLLNVKHATRQEWEDGVKKMTDLHRPSTLEVGFVELQTSSRHPCLRLNCFSRGAECVLHVSMLLHALCICMQCKLEPEPLKLADNVFQTVAGAHPRGITLAVRILNAYLQ